MKILEKIGNGIRKNSCEKLYNYTKNEITISGSNFGIGDHKITLGEISNKVKKFYEMDNIAVAMDNAQYLLCKTISTLEKDNPLRDDCIRIRLQIILGFNMLQAMVNFDYKNSDKFEMKLIDWIDNMRTLNLSAIEILKPKTRSAMTIQQNLSAVLKYQKINEEDIKNELGKLKDPQ